LYCLPECNYENKNVQQPFPVLLFRSTVNEEDNTDVFQQLRHRLSQSGGKKKKEVDFSLLLEGTF